MLILRDQTIANIGLPINQSVYFTLLSVFEFEPLKFPSTKLLHICCFYVVLCPNQNRNEHECISYLKLHLPHLYILTRLLWRTHLHYSLSITKTPCYLDCTHAYRAIILFSPSSPSSTLPQACRQPYSLFTSLWL